MLVLITQYVFLTTCKEHQEGKTLYERRINSTIRRANMSLPDQCLWPSSHQPSVSTHCKDADEQQGKKNKPTMMIWLLMHLFPAATQKNTFQVPRSGASILWLSTVGRVPARLLPCCVVLLPSTAPESEGKGCMGITTREFLRNLGLGYVWRCSWIPKVKYFTELIAFLSVVIACGCTVWTL